MSNNIDINSIIKKTVKKTVKKTLKEVGVGSSNTNVQPTPNLSKKKRQVNKKSPKQKAQEERHRRAMAEAKKLKAEGKPWNECLKTAWDNIKKSESNISSDNLAEKNGNTGNNIQQESVDIKQSENLAV